MKHNKNDYKTLMTYVWVEYCNEYKIVFCNCDVPHCFLKEKEIYFPINNFANPGSKDVFDMLHEVGHLKTNKKGMKRCEEEYHATQWAIKEMKKYDFDLSDRHKKLFQDYIWKWRDTGIKLKGKNMPSKKQLTLTW